jgi:hypothetical protein
MIDEQLLKKATFEGLKEKLTEIQNQFENVDEILSSKEYLELVENAKTEARECVWKKQPQERRLISPKPDLSYSAHSIHTLESGSLGSLVSGTCPKDDELPRLHQQLQHHSTAVRLEAAKVLALFSVGDLLADEFWPFTRLLLQVALVDPVVEIASISLEIYTRSFKLAPAYMIPELYSSYTTQVTP